MAGRRETGGPRDATPEADQPTPEVNRSGSTEPERTSSRGDAARRFAAGWSGRIVAAGPSLRRAVASPAAGAEVARDGAGPRPALAVRLGLVALLAVVLLGGGGALAALSHAPEDVAGQFCADALAGHYDAAYDLLGAALRAQVSRANFARIGAALDTLDGRVTACTATSYAYALGSGGAAVGARIVRVSGQSFSGQVRMDDENGWKVAALDPGLSGASLGAMDAALRFCDALRAGDSSRLLALTSGDASAGLGGAQHLATTLTTWQQVDGPVTGCTIAGTGSGAGAGAGAGASEAAARVSLSVTRAGRGTAVAGLALADGPSGWRVSAIGANLLGSDLGPLALGQRFCAALASGDYAGAYALFSPSYAAQVSIGQFTAAFAPLGGTWSCAPQLGTYSVAGASGSYEVALTLSGAGQPLALAATLRFSLAGGTWTIQAIEPHGR